MDPRKLVAINKKTDNVHVAPFPYWWAFQGESFEPKTTGKKMVIFFGNDMATFTKMGMSADLYIKKCNECLNYIRSEFNGHRLCYKPHPADKEELIKLNLTGFEVLDGGMNAELCLFQNREHVKAAFSIGSAAAYSAYVMGLNSYVFYKCFAGIYDREFIRPLDEFYYDMPQSFFIENFNVKIIDNAPILNKNESLERFFKQKLDNKQGRVWLAAFTAEYVVILIALVKLIKSIMPTEKIGLVISRHHYWDTVSADYFRKYFDKIVIWPRISYSLKPDKLWHAIRTAGQIKSFKIADNDILVSIAQNSFVENCLNSYHKKNFKIGLIADKDYNLFYNSQNSVYACNNNFRLIPFPILHLKSKPILV